MPIKIGGNSAIVISRPIGLAFLGLYSVQLIAIICLVWLYYQQSVVITDQNKRIEELENKLEILEIIEGYQIGFTTDETIQLAEVIHEDCAKFGLDPLLILSMIITESSFRRNQLSHKGAVGLMQIKPSIGRAVAGKWHIEWPSDNGLRNPVFNVRVGIAYLFELIYKFREIKQAVIAYNLGETVTREYLFFRATPPERYYKKVEKTYLELRRRLESEKS
ncbi:MAG: transglycosylase SLT domain-containing protein [candidate division Zixibacteria bacterium]